MRSFFYLSISFRPLLTFEVFKLPSDIYWHHFHPAKSPVTDAFYSFSTSQQPEHLKYVKA